jgi:hypothetical protein
VTYGYGFLEMHQDKCFVLNGEGYGGGRTEKPCTTSTGVFFCHGSFFKFCESTIQFPDK